MFQPRPDPRPPLVRRRSRLSLIRPFRALHPAPGRADAVLAPPYDVLSSAEARERAKGKPWSFLHISKPEIDLPPATDPYDRAVYAKAAENLDRMVAAGVLIRDPKESYYVYRLTWRDRRLQRQPHPQARAHDPGQGRRPGAPDRRHQRADRPGHDGLSGRARHRSAAGAR